MRLVRVEWACAMGRRIWRENENGGWRLNGVGDDEIGREGDHLGCGFHIGLPGGNCGMRRSKRERQKGNRGRPTQNGQDKLKP